MKNIKTTKLTLKAAKSLATLVMGTCKGIELIGDDGIYQRYSMTVGKFYVHITNDCGYWGVTRNVTRLSASTDRGGAEHYFDTKTLEELDNIADDVKRIAHSEELRELASENPMKLIDALSEAYKGQNNLCYCSLRQSLIEALEARGIPL